MRAGEFVSRVPTVVSRLLGQPAPYYYEQFLRSQSGTFILPGPMTIVDGCYNGYYDVPGDMTKDIVIILQREVLALVANGCTHIKIDEPALLNYPDKALEHGVDDIRIIFAGCPPHVKKEIILSGDAGVPSGLGINDSASNAIIKALEHYDIYQVKN